MAEQRKIYNNGLVAIADPLEGKKKIQLLIGIDVGSKDEQREKKGGAHLLEHMAFNSNEFRTAEEIAELGEFSGIEMNASTSAHNTIFYYWCPPEKIDCAVDLAFEAITCQEYKKEEFYREKSGPVTDELIGLERNPQTRFFQRFFLPAILRGTPFQDAIIGTFDSVSSLALEDLLNLKRHFYVPNNMKIIATGNVDSKMFFDKVEQTFAKLEAREVKQPQYSWDFVPRTEEQIFPEFEDSSDSRQNQAWVFFAYKVNSVAHEDSIPLSFIANVLTGGFTSRLFTELRRKRGIGYTPSGYYVGQNGASYLRLGLPGFKVGQLDEVKRVIAANVQELKEKPLAENYLEGKKIQMISKDLDTLESTSSRAKLLLANEFQPFYYDFREICSHVRNLTTEKIREVANRNLGEPLVAIGVPPNYKI